ncbi:NUDIX domain-containing protein [Amycolatopsis coloradensis]|uniref:NUDIX domain-containing protein n=1 Tax=Amycolatopsis coloradensis TaxID=76021 RepID=UPI000A064AC1|nr:NUDIX domain-containing protein [Amycolatopsis coloradensis]
MPITDSDIRATVTTYLTHYPGDAAALAEPLAQLATGAGFASRRTFPFHVTVGALLIRRGTHILLIDHRAYGIQLQPGGHLEPTDNDLPSAALRELTEETDVDPDTITLTSTIPAYIEYGAVPARPEKNEPPHFHLDIGYTFATANAEIRHLQKAEVTDASWHLLDDAERRVGSRISRARPLYGSGEPRPDLLHGTVSAKVRSSSGWC